VNAGSMRILFLAGVLLWRESLDLAGVVGIALIVAGVLVLNLFPGASAH
jgi:small multidrug resistance pump